MSRSVGQFVGERCHPPTLYAGAMFWFILLVIVVAGVVAWKMRVKLIAKLTGQSEARIGRQLGRRK